MKLTLAAVLGLAGLALAQDGAGESPVCPTVTKTVQERRCHKTCAFSDCTFETTVMNPCDCPTALETATLIAPCDADCPYEGCDIDFRTFPLPCPLSTPPTTTATSTRRRPWPPTTSTPSSSSSTPTSTSWTGVVTSVVTLPPHTHSTTKPPPPTITPCPTITRTTSPADCSAIRCPVPTCRVETDLVIPCGCTPNTLLYVQGCATDCPDGCLTRTRTVSEADC
jgi:hypothetical protein